MGGAAAQITGKQAGEKNLIVTLQRQPGGTDALVKFFWRKMDGRQEGIAGDVKRVIEMPALFSMQPAFVDGEAWLLKGAPIGSISYLIDGKTAVVVGHEPQENLPDVAGLGKHLEGIAFLVLKGEYGIESCSIRTDISF